MFFILFGIAGGSFIFALHNCVTHTLHLSALPSPLLLALLTHDVACCIVLSLSHCNNVASSMPMRFEQFSMQTGTHFLPTCHRCCLFKGPVSNNVFGSS
jgi:hypothetical protein